MGGARGRAYAIDGRICTRTHITIQGDGRHDDACAPMSMRRVFKTPLRRWRVKLRELSTEFTIINEYSIRVNKMKVFMDELP
nr:hypothetical protein [Tanacetum cinerariifolium]